MEKNSSRIAFITDRGPKDLDPISVWVWQEILDLAKSGKEIRIYLLADKKIPVEYHHSRIHIVPGFDLNPRHLMAWNPDCIHILEPIENGLQSKLQYGKGLFLIPGLKQSGLIQSQMATTFFSEKPNRSWLMSFWCNFTDQIYYSHPKFAPPSSFSPSRAYPIPIQLFDQNIEPHWSMEQLENKIVIPGSLGDIEKQSGLFLEKAKEVLILKPWTKFLFLKGLGTATSKVKRQFLNSEFASYLIFPESLTGSQIYHAMAKASSIWFEFQDSSTPLAGLSMQIHTSKQNSRLDSQSNSQLSSDGISTKSVYMKSTYGPL